MGKSLIPSSETLREVLKGKSLSVCLFATPWTIIQSMEFSILEYGSG